MSKERLVFFPCSRSSRMRTVFIETILPIFRGLCQLLGNDSTLEDLRNVRQKTIAYLAEMTMLFRDLWGRLDTGTRPS